MSRAELLETLRAMMAEKSLDEICLLNSVEDDRKAKGNYLLTLKSRISPLSREDLESLFIYLVTTYASEGDQILTNKGIINSNDLLQSYQGVLDSLDEATLADKITEVENFSDDDDQGDDDQGDDDQGDDDQGDDDGDDNGDDNNDGGDDADDDDDVDGGDGGAGAQPEIDDSDQDQTDR